MKKSYQKPTMESVLLLGHEFLLNGSMGVHDDETLGGDEFLSNQDIYMDIWQWMKQQNL